MAGLAGWVAWVLGVLGTLGALGALGAGDVVTAKGVVHGKPYVSKAGQQRYLTVLRLREVVLERKAAVPAEP